MIVFGSHSQKGIKTDADGLVGNKCSQNLWVYTADCMPIFFADKRKRNVATCLLYTSPSPRDPKTSRMPSSA